MNLMLPIHYSHVILFIHLNSSFNIEWRAGRIWASSHTLKALPASIQDASVRFSCEMSFFAAESYFLSKLTLSPFVSSSRFNVHVNVPTAEGGSICTLHLMIDVSPSLIVEGLIDR